PRRPGAVARCPSAAGVGAAPPLHRGRDAYRPPLLGIRPRGGAPDAADQLLQERGDRGRLRLPRRARRRALLPRAALAPRAAHAPGRPPRDRPRRHLPAERCYGMTARMRLMVCRVTCAAHWLSTD